MGDFKLMEKNRFLTFLFSLIPGAGHMYLGLMKKGVSLMLAFGAVFTLCNFLNIGLINFILPVIWFYCFFDTLTLSRFDPHDRAIDEANFMEQMNHILKQDWKQFLTTYRTPIGTAALLIGIYAFFSNFVMPYLYRFGNWGHSFSNLFYNIPTALLSVGLVGVGIYLLTRYHTNNE